MENKDVLKLYEDEDDRIEIVEEDEWTQDHKYQHRDVIIRLKDTGDYYCVSESRSGSYHTDWYYDEPYIQKVRKVTKTIVVDTWESIKD